MSKKLQFVLLIVLFVGLSYKYGYIARRGVAEVTSNVAASYLFISEYIKNSIDEHFAQQETIKKLKAENKALERSSLLASIYGEKLNRILKANENEPFGPTLELVEALSYEQISNYSRVWVRMKDFNASKIYGLVHKGSSAGIVISKDGKALGLLQGDNKCVFSVAVGKNMLPGVAFGKGKLMHIKYIPLWMEPKVGDKVVTSGLDKIFVEGIHVGKVIEVVEEESYKMAIVKPDITTNNPRFFYVIKN